MLILLSPAKTLEDSPATIDTTQARLLDRSAELVEILKGKSSAELSHLMSISDKLAEQNFERYQRYEEPFTDDNAAAAILTFKGDVYQDLDANDFSEEEMNFANWQLRILSGLYGILRPRDLMQPYRLEMGTKLPTERGKNLYEFWGNTITDVINQDLAEEGSKLLLNLASQEYFKSINTEAIQGTVLTAHFKERRKGKYRVVSFNAKRARGKMARLITLEGIRTAAPLKDLVVNDYVYNDELSSETDYVYTKD